MTTLASLRFKRKKVLQKVFLVTPLNKIIFKESFRGKEQKAFWKYRRENAFATSPIEYLTCQTNQRLFFICF